MNKIKIKKEIIEWIICFVIAYVIYIVVNFFVGTISGVKQTSMKPTANEGDRLVISRNIIAKQKLKHGDIITFSAPDETQKITDGNDNIADYKNRNFFTYNFLGINKKSYIKRVIGLPKDRIKLYEGDVYKNGIKINEPYLNGIKTISTGPYIDVVVPDNTVFVMGDNRSESMDSRIFGCIPFDKIEGNVLFRIFPFNKMGKL
ncbi:MAG: signal peptidase I [Clostridia bacterium]